MKAYKLIHKPTGLYLSKTYRNKWTLGPKGKTWSVKQPSLIAGGFLMVAGDLPDKTRESMGLGRNDELQLYENEFDWVELSDSKEEFINAAAEWLYDRFTNDEGGMPVTASGARELVEEFKKDMLKILNEK
jgi:bifunctional DNA-binding transcriptional regulator/antitoxin component of YhaV-PrlF toxin-antitoxin module